MPNDVSPISACAFSFGFVDLESRTISFAHLAARLAFVEPDRGSRAHLVQRLQFLWFQKLAPEVRKHT